jgi:hypothetical protein
MFASYFGLMVGKMQDNLRIGLTTCFAAMGITNPACGQEELFCITRRESYITEVTGLTWHRDRRFGQALAYSQGLAKRQATR